MILEHERVEFFSFPCEWPPECSIAAGMLTLDLATGRWLYLTRKKERAGA